MLYTKETAGEILKMIKGSKKDCYPYNHYKNIRKELCVHTQGKLFDKILTIFRNEKPETTKFVLESYEPVTTASIKKGIDSLSRIFKNNGVNIVTDADTYEFIINKNYTKDIIDEYINCFVSQDPNSVLVPYFDDGKKEWEIESVESDEIISIGDDYIIFIDEENSDYHYEKKHICGVNRLRNLYLEKEIDHLLFEEVKVYDRLSYIYISKEQYITFTRQIEDKENIIVEIKDFKEKIEPYSKLCPEKYGDVCESPIQGFVPYGNIALIQHRASRCVEQLFGYPRMSEVEFPCDSCNEQGKVPCETGEDSCYETCKKCNGTGSLTMQSIFKIYTRKLNDEYKDFDPVRYHTPDVAILEHIQDNWQKSIELGEKAIYVQQNSETGNVQSAQSREKQMEEKYAWLDRIANAFYEGAEDILNTISVLNNKGKITLEKPLSYAIMSEIESFEYLNQLVSSDAPALIKSTHIENFLKKYVSVNSPIIKAVNVLKRVDKFIFTTESYLEKLSNNAIVQDKDWIVHAYAYPLLSQMVANDTTLLNQDVDFVVNALNKEIEPYLPKQMLDILDPTQTGSKLTETVGGLQGVIEIAKAIATGMYDLEAGVKLVSSLYKVSEEEAKAWLGTPQLATQQVADKVQNIL